MIVSWSTALWLAETGQRSSEETLREAVPALLVLFAVLVTAIIIACIVIYVVRSRSLRSDTTRADIPLTLSEIRRMHDEGEIDDLECERLKDIVTQQVRAEASTPAGPRSGPPVEQTPQTSATPEPPPSAEDTEE